MIDAETSARIRAFEDERGRSGGLRWQTILVLALGAVMLGAGVLLFVSAHWDNITPASRFLLVLAMVAAFHLGGAFTGSFPSLSIVLHAVGTVALGAGIALTGQIFHLDVHWPSGIMLWAFGAAIGWAVLRSWPQAALLAILVPYWLGGEWLVTMEDLGVKCIAPVQIGAFLFALTYFTARRSETNSALRKALVWIGGLSIIPAAGFLKTPLDQELHRGAYQVAGFSVAILLPTAVALILRRRGVVWNLAGAAWAVILYFINNLGPYQEHTMSYAWCALGAIGLTLWGLREAWEAQVNLGVAAFAITVVEFYFSSVMDKLGRSASLIGLGILFLVGGWFLERARRRLIARVRA